MMLNRKEYYAEQHQIRFLRREAHEAADVDDFDLADQYNALADCYARRFPFCVLLRPAKPVGSLKRRLEDFRIRPPF